MRKRVVLAVITLSLVVVTVALAQQQTGDKQGDRRVSKASLRARVIKIHAELELFELEHESDKATFST